MLTSNEIKYDFSGCNHAKSRPDSFQRAKAAISLGLESFGPELDDYLDRYGYLESGEIKLFGMTGHEFLESDLIRVTRECMRSAAWPKGHVVLRRVSDNRLAVAGPDDSIYFCDADGRNSIASGMGVYEYAYFLFLGNR